MKSILTGINVLIFLPATLFSLRASATECVNDVFAYERLYWSYCQNYSSYSQGQTMIRKGDAILLNDYIDSLIRQGKLADKKFQITTGTLFGSPMVQFTQSDKYYFIEADNYDPKLESMIKIINYFASPAWKPFYYGSYATNGDRLDALMENLPAPDMRFFRNKDKVVRVIRSGSDSAKVIYRNEKLSCSYHAQNIYMNAQYLQPALMNGRLVLMSDDSAFVYSDTSLLCATDFPFKNRPFTGFLRMECFTEWASFYSSDDKPFLTYSYTKNRFYVLKPANK